MDNKDVKFSWIPFYEEMANRLLAYQTKRDDLLKFFYLIFPDNGTYHEHNKEERLSDIDPFTFMGCFNRSISERIIIANKIAESLGMQQRLSDDEKFAGIPVINALHTMFFASNDDGREEDDIDKLWKVFKTAMSGSSEFTTAFDNALRVKGTGLTYLTDGLYWINPDKFISLDQNNVKYLKHYGITVSKKITGEKYLDIVDEVKKKMQNEEIKEKTFHDISYEAWSKYGKKGDHLIPTDMESSNDKFVNILKRNRNIVLTGAPGTGKTYMAKQIAAQMILNKPYSEELERDETFKTCYRFVQFHPSYDYTDFVEGLRPTEPTHGDGNVGFERRDGVFKEFCKRALLSATVQQDDDFKELNQSPTVWKVSLEGTYENPTRTDCLKNGYIRIGWSNYGDRDFSDDFGFPEGGRNVLRAFQTSMQIGDIVLSCYSAKEIDAIGIVTGEYEYNAKGGDYPRYRSVKWIVKDIRQNIFEVNNRKTLTLATVYRLEISVDDVIKLARANKKEKSTKENKVNTPFIFIIDEINRGEISKIFGELFFSIDPSYRGEKGMVQTQYQNMIEEGDTFKKGFYVPDNVYIIGTMNDIDRSVESMDFAMRRRFTWIEITAEESAVNMKLPKESVKRMTHLNNAISRIEGLNRSYYLGGAYFTNLQDDNYDDLWTYRVDPLLKEYLRGFADEDKKLVLLKNAYNGTTDDDKSEKE